MDELRELVATKVGKDIEEEIVTLADRLREEGRQKGEQKGLQKGALDGRRDVLLKLLTLRFGKLPQAAVSRVNASETALLETWIERVLTAPTLADVIDAP